MDLYLKDVEDAANKIFEPIDRAPVVNHSERKESEYPDFRDWSRTYDVEWANERLTQYKKDDILRSESQPQASQFFIQNACPALKKLNSGQQKIFDYVTKQLEENKQILLLVHGAPGTGKTTLARTIVSECIKYHMKAQLVALTGVTATAGEGYTIHKFLEISARWRDVVKHCAATIPTNTSHCSIPEYRQVLTNHSHT